MNLRSIGRRGSHVVWWFISVGLFVGIWELTFALGLYSVKILPPPHVFLADLPKSDPSFRLQQAQSG